MFVCRHARTFPWSPVDRRHWEAFLTPEVCQTVHIGIRSGIGRLARGADKGGCRGKQDEEVQVEVPCQLVQHPGTGCLGSEDFAEPFHRLGEQNAVVQHAGRVENTPDRSMHGFQISHEPLHRLPVGHIGLHIPDISARIGFQRRLLDSPSARDDHQTGSPVEQPVCQDSADPARAARDEVSPARTYDWVVIAQVHRNRRFVVHEHQFARVPGLRHEPEGLRRPCYWESLIGQGLYRASPGHFDDLLQQATCPDRPFLDELREIDGMIGPVLVEMV
ncbi:MAG: hypothetical protein OXH02_07000 [Gemmatimonadetes bacterium]|nr:hypothetical protein [Gemmatimonadota bacterium]